MGFFLFSSSSSSSSSSSQKHQMDLENEKPLANRSKDGFMNDFTLSQNQNIKLVRRGPPLSEIHLVREPENKKEGRRERQTA